MKTPSLIVGTALIGIAIGFIAGSKRTEMGRATSGASTEGLPRTRSSRSADALGKADIIGPKVVKGRDFNKMSAAAALEMVKANAKAWDPGSDPLETARQNYEYQLMLSRLPLAELEQLMTLTKDSGVADYRRRQLFGVYASRDIDKAIAWAATQPDADSWKSAAVATLSAKDPSRAMEMYQEVILSGNWNPFSGANMEGSALAAIFAKQGKTAFFQFLDSMPSGASNVLSTAMRSLPKEDLPGFIAELEQRGKAGTMEEWTMTSALGTLALNDPDLARGVFEKMEAGPQRVKCEMSLARAFAQQGKTAEALELVKSAMAEQPGKEKEFFMHEAGNLTYNNPGLMNEIARALPPEAELTIDDIKNLTNYGIRKDLVNMAKLLKSPADQAIYLEDAIGNLVKRKPNATDFQILEHRIESLGLTGANLNVVQSKLAATRQTVLGK